MSSHSASPFRAALSRGHPCIASSSNSLHVAWAKVDSAAMYDVQLQQLPPGTPCDSSIAPPFMSQTSSVSSLLVEDLDHGSLFRILVRYRDAQRNWNATLFRAFCCSTAGLDETQPWVRLPLSPPSAHRMTVTVDPPKRTQGFSGQIDLQCRERSAQAAVPWQHCGSLSAPNLSASVGGLESGMAYHVRALAVFAPGVAALPSDPVAHRTASDAWESLEVYRISELCGDVCEPDFLYNHDGGTALADIGFITHEAAHGEDFNVTFNGSVIARYCVSRRLEAFADYVSCDSAAPGLGPEFYRCSCTDFIDRCIARGDLSVCNASQPFDFEPPCYCSNASLSLSAMRIGRMPTYMPWFAWPPDFSNGTCGVPSKEVSFFTGYWYSMPADAECKPPSSMGGLERPCSWSREASLHMVHGGHLRDMGFDASDEPCSGAHDIPGCAQQVHHNTQLLLQAFAEHSSRCCGC